MENEFIKILGKADWEDDVIEIIEKYKFLEDSEFEEGDSEYWRWTPSCAFAHLTFNNECKTSEQKERKKEGNYYFQKMVFDFYGDRDSDGNVIGNTDGLDVPFGLKKGDTYKDVIEKLGEPHLELKKLNKEAPALRKWWQFKKENGELYQVGFLFDNETPDLILDEMTIFALDPLKEQLNLVPHSYDPLKDK